MLLGGGVGERFLHETRPLLLAHQWELSGGISPSMCLAGALLRDGPAKRQPWDLCSWHRVTPARLCSPGLLYCSRRWSSPPPGRSDSLRELETGCKIPQRHFQGVIFGKQPIVRTTLGAEELVFYFSGFSEMFSVTCGSGFCFLFQLWKLCAYVWMLGCKGLQLSLFMKIVWFFSFPHLQPVTQSGILHFTACFPLPSMSINSFSPDPCVFLPFICYVPYYL